MSNIKGLKPNPNSKYKQGYFAGATKYVGPEPVIYRSLLEYRFMVQCELNPNILKWSSENIQIPYYMNEKNAQGKFVPVKHIYNIDFTLWMKNGAVYVVEIKPSSLTPLNEAQIKRNPIMYKNACKWKAAILWCKQRGYIFKVITEKDLKKSIVT